ncbi:MAG: fumarate reductase cytochrome b subunit [Gammaproteobacteria bacterium]|jgi:fumarate reductase subunit C|nr:fumarate reductase cytochrome b subunit [Gammaproteobacteria bacterium]MBK6583636.1 fumarate reductase cytochrome b subunit [Gammaproteobacteria bacterium]MBK7169858.1 fumarate reductase cytochrome b subunit [Gammaproteobacteria bacterium]MBK8309317.1 fumarate reductase cytochrome b subunit [Gammaproteobacteria bacterium]MBK9665445.1 fumarate reductase cytochrome b subunit [Gammaproteobacteria bacterium]
MRQQQSRTATSQLNTTPAPIDKGPARLDLIQGASGLLLVLFMWVHMGLVSSILISKDAMHAVTRAMEGEFLFRRPVPGLVSAAVLAVAALVLVHALASIRRMPASYREYRGFMKHARMLRHADTWLWLLQVITGLVLMFVVAIHLYEMALHPGAIGPYASADRAVSGRMWPLDLLMLYAVEIHAGIGLYRLILKWGWIRSSDPRRMRRRLRLLITLIVVFFLVLGTLTLATYVRIGLEHRDRAGERYVPEHPQVPGNRGTH